MVSSRLHNNGLLSFIRPSLLNNHLFLSSAEQPSSLLHNHRFLLHSGRGRRPHQYLWPRLVVWVVTRRPHHHRRWRGHSIIAAVSRRADNLNCFSWSPHHAHVVGLNDLGTLAVAGFNDFSAPTKWPIVGFDDFGAPTKETIVLFDDDGLIAVAGVVVERVSEESHVAVDE